MNPYLPVLIILFFAIAVGTLISLLAGALGPQNPSPLKKEVFECGVPAVGHRERMSVRFYLTAILFILFDIETVFLFLWAKAFRELGWFGVVEIFVFMAILIAGYVYILQRRALEWD